MQARPCAAASPPAASTHQRASNTYAILPGWVVPRLDCQTWALWRGRRTAIDGAADGGIIMPPQHASHPP